nr:putative proteinase inhibitor [Saccharum hybrid cultivar R570]
MAGAGGQDGNAGGDGDRPRQAGRGRGGAPAGSPVVPGYNPERVRVYIDSNGLVANVPVIG